MRNKWFRSLQFQVFATTAAGTLVVTAIATFLLSGMFADQLRAGLARKAEAVGDLIAANTASAFDFEQPDAAKGVLETALRDKEVVYALAARTDGAKFASVGKPPAGLPVREKAGATGRQIFESAGLVHVVTPVQVADRRLGVILVGFSLADIEAKSAEIRRGGLAAAAGITLVFTLVMFVTLRRIVVRPVSLITRVMGLIGDGDLRRQNLLERRRLSAEIEVMYRALDRTAEAFRGNVVAISESSRQFAAMADEILGSTTNLSGTASEQAGAINEISVTLEEMEKTGRVSAHSAGAIAAAADESVKVSSEGLAAVDDTVTQLRDIKAQVDAMVESVQQLDRRLDEVDKIVITVNDVTRQSHTLSINASIEAAKAGSAGRGFAIVANKVRDLAQQSRLATDDIRTTLANIQVAMRAVAESSESGRQRAERGVESIERTGRVIRRLSEVIRTTAEAARGIAANANEQVVGLGETLRAMVEIKLAAQHHLEGAREVESQGERLSSKAMEMEGLVSRFKTDG
jgi:methyl-accepting chemotaxis protein